MSKRKSGLNIDGILLLDKRIGVSSNRALQEVRRLFNANKAGHTGSLDPLATGLLPLCFGEATKVSALMLDDNKSYQVIIQLGVITDTGDAEGQILATNSVPNISAIALSQCLQNFTGVIAQIPPMYSALKHQGKKLYELARAGKTVERKAREINIFSIKLLNSPITSELNLVVSCSKGTYIRTLATDIGEYFGCGATVKALRRLQSGIFNLDEAYTISQLKIMTSQELHNVLLPVDTPLQALSKVQLSESQKVCIQYGQSIQIAEISLGTVRMYANGEFLGLGENSLNGTLAPKKLFNLHS